MEHKKTEDLEKLLSEVVYNVEVYSIMKLGQDYIYLIPTMIQAMYIKIQNVINKLSNELPDKNFFECIELAREIHKEMENATTSFMSGARYLNECVHLLVSSCKSAKDIANITEQKIELLRKEFDKQKGSQNVKIPTDIKLN